jgi:hypothetical protein
MNRWNVQRQKADTSWKYMLLTFGIIFGAMVLFRLGIL